MTLHRTGAGKGVGPASEDATGIRRSKGGDGSRTESI